ncbi:tryptophan-rich sensory protein [Maribacter sp. SA7]|uniref:tryptophan-rich sensory protein n=1 Tax=Maribacter zhoushanensis TaxID=3030012 RepID=UPI0023ED3CD4|nr:tryptophan-rich sensory protein [Maribacter zhoushanensis]MDF4204363.1 tryptophan-rich sensory protein [Maribacter zhoushanensis]
MEQGKLHLTKFQKRWQLLSYTEAVLYALGIAVLCYFITKNILVGLVAFVVGLLFVILVKKPWQHNLNTTSSFIDAHVSEASFSTGLLLQPEDSLSNLAKLQRYRVSEELSKRLGGITPPNGLKQAFLVMLACIAIGLIVHQMNLFQSVDEILNNPKNTEQIQFVAIDSLQKDSSIPEIENQKITVVYPSYTRLGSKTTANANIKAVAGSKVIWSLQFDNPVVEPVLDVMGELKPLNKVGDDYQIELPLKASGFYSFKFKNEEGTEFTSDLFSLEATADDPPEIEILGLEQYTYFDFSDKKIVQLQSSITDDFGIDESYIITTVSKGTGESVKFREEKLNFKEAMSKGVKSIRATKTLDLNALKMEVGDELYFYIEAFDEKQPRRNVARSETYFAVIKDTVSEQFGVEGTLGVDQMPDYFRSQRQLIIDTEKLIKDKPSITIEEFKTRSNELGFDQKALRLKYGQFMGDEAEMEEAPAEIESHEEGEEHDHAEDQENVIKDFMHDHDGDNEHNLVEQHEHGHEGDAEEPEDPLHDYLHNHDDPEESTLFEESLKTKLRKALSIMWDAELHLRLYEPEKSLPFQYDALKYIQEIKNSARIYVHRIGFDPPPIKEDSRLTGKIKDIKNYRKNESTTAEEPFEAIEKAIGRLEQLVQKENAYTKSDNALFTAAGNELAQLAIENPGKYLQVLQGLKRIENNTGRTIENFRFVQKGLFLALPKAPQKPGAEKMYVDEINSLFLKQLEVYD